MSTCSNKRKKLCGNRECDICFSRSLQYYLEQNNLQHCWISEKNDIEPLYVSQGSEKKVYIKCKNCEVVYYPSIKYYTRCLKCTSCSDRDKSTEKFIEKAQAIHGNKYVYDMTLYKNSKQHVVITCRIHGDYRQTPNMHLSGNGCPDCGIESAKEKLRKLPSDFLKEAISLHGNNYIYDKTDYINCNTPVTITCRIHGDFMQVPSDHLSGCGCPSCALENNSLNRRLTTEEFIQRAICKHNDTYQYDCSKYITAEHKVDIRCKSHGVFHQKPHDHINGAGCPYCINKTEGKLYKWLQEQFPGVEIITQYRPDFIRGRRYDFYIPSLNLIIEVDGPQHFVDIPNWELSSINQKVDIFKMIKANKNNLSVIRILQEDIWNDRNNWDTQLIQYIHPYDIPANIFIGTDIYDIHRNLLRRGVIIQDMLDGKQSRSTNSIKSLISILHIDSGQSVLDIKITDKLHDLDVNILNGYKVVDDRLFAGIYHFLNKILGINTLVDQYDTIICISMNMNDSLYHLLTA